MTNFHRLHDRKKWSESYDRWSNHYNKWYNKYRNEIYNGNKIMEERVDGEGDVNDYCQRVRTDCRVIFGYVY
jgi:hypothetical protein